jgi:putative NIF3 family GTP cyclohydrolase 1 type 2
MKAQELYDQLEKDFITPKMSDDWASHMDSVADFITDNFKQRSMGLVCDFTTEIGKVYTAVFPSDAVLQKVIDAGAENSMLFVHHPAIWDIRKAPEIFQQMNPELLKKFREKNIAIYNLHVPLDNFGGYSTSGTLAKALGIEITKSFAPYFGGMAGVFGKTDCKTASELQQKFTKAVGHEVKLYRYGEEEIAGGKVAVVAGGGLSELNDEVVENNINIMVTGITARSAHSEPNHKFAEEHKINILGGTHYSTETFACIAMVGYFKKLGLPAEFISDKPVMEDM